MDENILEQLPHGSGINGDWRMEDGKRSVVLFNTYSAMNEAGMYCHDYPFYVKYAKKGSYFCYSHLVLGRTHKCCGDDLEDYLIDTMPMTIQV